MVHSSLPKVYPLAHCTAHPSTGGMPRPPVPRPTPHSKSRDYINLEEALPEEPVPAPITRHKKGAVSTWRWGIIISLTHSTLTNPTSSPAAPPKAKSVDYVNLKLEEPSLLGGDDYSVLKPEPRHPSLDQDYSHLELPDERTHINGKPTGPPPKDKGRSPPLGYPLHHAWSYIHSQQCCLPIPCTSVKWLLFSLPLPSLHFYTPTDVFQFSVTSMLLTCVTNFWSYYHWSPLPS